MWINRGQGLGPSARLLPPSSGIWGFPLPSGPAQPRVKMDRAVLSRGRRRAPWPLPLTAGLPPSQNETDGIVCLPLPTPSRAKMGF